ncbi:hypothetical protein [Synechococcus sp. PCC 6312]|uniref:hypothetical protein n=1 Tax=Synechococcus sp. (strain ATCC 27167 / PCC 6312) TaxID=195253 RepID=UPI00029EEF44|nr:hypothetical protein [Synechococcus sp. PCC 6312]AFY61969.1 hypothetical protein Syn6312_2906 [Synechococcus sp. PCC 6312]
MKARPGNKIKLKKPPQERYEFGVVVTVWSGGVTAHIYDQDGQLYLAPTGIPVYKTFMEDEFHLLHDDGTLVQITKELTSGRTN